MESRFQDMEMWVRGEAAFLRDAVKKRILFTEKTSYADIVTAYDKRVESSLREKILLHYPGDGVVGEESGCVIQEGCEYIWYIDPIDGTTNFVYQKNNFAVSVACFRRGRCEFALVMDVINNVMYHACRGQGAWKNGERIWVNAERKNFHEVILSTPIVQDVFIRQHSCKNFFEGMAEDVCAVRSMGCISLELCLLAEGKAGIFVAMRSCPWDHNAAALIVCEAGGSVCSMEGKELGADYSGPVAAFSNRSLRLLFYRGLEQELQSTQEEVYTP